MKNKAFIFTLDAILAFIPLFIILGSVSTITVETKRTDLALLRQAGDAVEILFLGDTPLADQYIDNSSKSTSIQAALNGTASYNFELRYSRNYTNQSYVAGRAGYSTAGAVVTASRNNASNIYSAERIRYRNGTTHIFSMFVWVQ